MDIERCDTLRARFRGEIFTPADGERYDRARALFNAMHDHRRPLVVARATGVADVIAALSFAREHDLPLAVRGGGHSVAGYSTIDRGIVIDLGPMKGVRVDPSARRVRAQAGLRWGELDRETQAFGLATTGGRVSTTGISGLTLGSGTGWLDKLHGLTCDNLVSVDLVTAEGRVVVASETENPELFWGVRGAGANFGIVTGFEYRLHRVGPTVFGGLLYHPAEAARDVIGRYRDFIQDAPRELGGGLTLRTAPAAPFVPPPLRGRPVVSIVAVWFGPLDRAERALAPLRALGRPCVDTIGPRPYVALQSMLDESMPFGRRNYWRSSNLRGLPDDAIDTLIDRQACVTSPFTQIILTPMGGAVRDLPEDATALGGRKAPWQIHCYGAWTSGDDAEHIAWVRGTDEAMAPHASAGLSLNFVSDVDHHRVRAQFGPDKYRRLVALKDEHDPDNLFRSNQNVLPSRLA